MAYREIKEAVDAARREFDAWSEEIELKLGKWGLKGKCRAINGTIILMWTTMEHVQAVEERIEKIEKEAELLEERLSALEASWNQGKIKSLNF